MHRISSHGGLKHLGWKKVCFQKSDWLFKVKLATLILFNKSYMKTVIHVSFIYLMTYSQWRKLVYPGYYASLKVLKNLLLASIRSHIFLQNRFSQIFCKIHGKKHLRKFLFYKVLAWKHVTILKRDFRTVDHIWHLWSFKALRSSSPWLLLFFPSHKLLRRRTLSNVY